MQKNKLTIDARSLFSTGVGTYLRGILKRMPFQALNAQTKIFVSSQEGVDWLRQFHPHIEIAICPEPTSSVSQQLFWKKHLTGEGLFWASNTDIPMGGYEHLAVTVHDCFGLSTYAPLFKKLRTKAQFRAIRKNADVIITCSEFTRHQLHQHARIFDIPTYVVPLGVEPTWFTRTLPKREYPFNYLLYVGHWEPHKNIHALLKAYQKLRPQQKLVCVGPNRTLPNYDKKAYNLAKSMKDRVVIADYVDDSRLMSIVKHADGLVLPSLYEGFGLPPLEAMASRVPVMVSQTAALPETCGDAALYCDPYTVDGIADGIQLLLGLRGSERARRLAEGSDHAAKYNWDKTVEDTFDILKTALF